MDEGGGEALAREWKQARRSELAHEQTGARAAADAFDDKGHGCAGGGLFEAGGRQECLIGKAAGRVR